MLNQKWQTQDSSIPIPANLSELYRNGKSIEAVGLKWTDA